MKEPDPFAVQVWCSYAGGRPRLVAQGRVGDAFKILPESSWGFPWAEDCMSPKRLEYLGRHTAGAAILKYAGAIAANAAVAELERLRQAAVVATRAIGATTAQAWEDLIAEALQGLEKQAKKSGGQQPQSIGPQQEQASPALPAGFPGGGLMGEGWAPVTPEELGSLGRMFRVGSGRTVTVPAAPSNCTANPSCGQDDVVCPVCRAGNCPGVKCWRGC